MKNVPKIQPLGDKVLIQPLSETELIGKSKGGIIIPDTVDKGRPEQGKILAVGEGRTTDNGQILTPKVKKGQIVIFAKFGPDEIKIDGEEYLIVSESQILAVIN